MSQHEIAPAVLKRLKELGGNKLIIGLIQMYLERTPAKIQAISHAIERTDYAVIENTAHSLIASTGNLGGMGVSNLSVKLEQAAMEKNMEVISRVASELLVAEETFTAYLKEELEKI
ncbi:MAG: Hpt domain-containing protein [Candidatus Marinimicrobia bacterium]|nr:Hpt domain-containing protein [Candidatus Neomarinimicrobiota bacterium]